MYKVAFPTYFLSEQILHLINNDREIAQEWMLFLQSVEIDERISLQTTSSLNYALRIEGWEKCWYLHVYFSDYIENYL